MLNSDVIIRLSDCPYWCVETIQRESKSKKRNLLAPSLRIYMCRLHWIQITKPFTWQWSGERAIIAGKCLFWPLSSSGSRSRLLIWGRKDRISHTLWVIYDESLVSDKRAVVNAVFRWRIMTEGVPTIESRFNSTSTVLKRTAISVKIILQHYFLPIK